MAIFRGRRMQVRYEKSLFPTNIWLYLGNDTRRGHCYYGMPIGTHMRTTNGHFLLFLFECLSEIFNESLSATAERPVHQMG